MTPVAEGYDKSLAKSRLNESLERVGRPPGEIGTTSAILGAPEDLNTVLAAARAYADLLENGQECLACNGEGWDLDQTAPMDCYLCGGSGVTPRLSEEIELVDTYDVEGPEGDLITLEPGRYLIVRVGESP